MLNLAHRTWVKHNNKNLESNFSKKSGRLSSTGSEILTFGSHCSANFQPILDCFIPKFKLEYDDLENIKTNCVNTVVFDLHQIKQSKFFLGHTAEEDML